MGFCKKEEVTSSPNEGCVLLVVSIHTATPDASAGTERDVDLQSSKTEDAATYALEGQRGCVANLAQRCLFEIEKKSQVVEYNLNSNVCEKNGPSQGAQHKLIL